MPSYLSSHRELQIETEARELQRDVWVGRFRQSCVDPIDALEPGIALNMLGYSVNSEMSLGQFSDQGRLTEVAGSIDRVGRRVSISMRFDEVHRRFTTAHELGHAVLHPNGRATHRDRPLAGPSANRPLEEAEADRFASAYLLPEKYLREQFVWRFGRVPLKLDEHTRFYLCGTTADVRQMPRLKRDFSMLLSRSISFGGRAFNALHAQFQVSPMTMAIRLEELGLVSWR